MRLLKALDGNGVPALSAVGDLLPSAPLTLVLKDARAHAAVVLLVSPLRVDMPTKGGVLVPFPSLVLSLLSDASGGFSITTKWPAGITGPLTVWVQAWVTDPAGPKGFTASNGLGGNVP